MNQASRLTYLVGSLHFFFSWLLTLQTKSCLRMINNKNLTLLEGETGDGNGGQPMPNSRSQGSTTHVVWPLQCCQL